MITIFGLVGFAVMAGTTVWLAVRYIKTLKYMRKLEHECNKVRQTIPDERQRLMVQCNKRVEEKVNEIHQNVNEVQVGIIAQALCGQSARDLQSSMKNLIEATYSRMSQEFVGALADETDGLVQDLNVNLCERIWDSVQQMKIYHDESPYVLPSSAVIVYTKGNRTVVVIEQTPQVRTMGFTSGLVGHTSRNAAISSTDKIYRFNLAFPYVYFFIAFDGTTFSHHKVFFRNSPLKSVREHVYNPPIPNIHKGKNYHLTMCMGDGFKESVNQENTIAKACENVVSGFWQRPFNNHLGSGHTSDTDKRVKSYKRWQEETKKDSMFILDVKWGKGKAAKSILDEIFKNRDMKHPRDDIDKKIRWMLENGVEGVSKALKDAIDSAKKNNTLKAGSFDKVVKDQLEKVVVSHTKKVFEQCTRI